MGLFPGGVLVEAERHTAPVCQRRKWREEDDRVEENKDNWMFCTGFGKVLLTVSISVG